MFKTNLTRKGLLHVQNSHTRQLIIVSDITVNIEQASNICLMSLLLL